MLDKHYCNDSICASLSLLIIPLPEYYYVPIVLLKSWFEVTQSIFLQSRWECRTQWSQHSRPVVLKWLTILNTTSPKYLHVSSSKQYIRPTATTLEWMTRSSPTESGNLVSENSHKVLLADAWKMCDIFRPSNVYLKEYEKIGLQVLKKLR